MQLHPAHREIKRRLSPTPFLTASTCLQLISFWCSASPPENQGLEDLSMRAPGPTSGLPCLRGIPDLAVEDTVDVLCERSRHHAVASEYILLKDARRKEAFRSAALFECQPLALNYEVRT